MLFRLLRLSGLVGILVVLATVVAPNTSRLYADAVCIVRHEATSYYYAGGAAGTVGPNTDGDTTSDASACVAAGQYLAIKDCSGTCVYQAGVSHGTYGVAYCITDWDVWYDSQYLGHVQQQYDCGDV